MTLSQDIAALVPQAEALEADLAELITLARAYMEAPNGADADEAAALTAFLAAHQP